jgi:L-ascorbate metabolism protein UlaG (beta-lactamase superfamily)
MQKTAAPPPSITVKTELHKQKYYFDQPRDENDQAIRPYKIITQTTGNAIEIDAYQAWEAINKHNGIIEEGSEYPIEYHDPQKYSTILSTSHVKRDKKGIHTHDHVCDAGKIGAVTVASRLINSLISIVTLSFKGRYFAHGEKDKDIYDLERVGKQRHFFIRSLCYLINLFIEIFTLFQVQNYFRFDRKSVDLENFLRADGDTIQNIGHATQLLSFKGAQDNKKVIRVLTDPVEDHLNSLLYRATTSNARAFDELPEIDAIVLSHRHRDHLCKDSLKRLVKNFPDVQIIVPFGDEELVRSWLPEAARSNVQGIAWGDEVVIKKDGQEVKITGTPANHWGNRGITDVDEAYTNGYLIGNDKSLVYFAGDTALLKDEHVKQLGKVIKQKKQDDPDLNFVNSLPGGPNYPAKLMKDTHMSIAQSFLLHLQLCKQLGGTLQENLAKTPLVMMHRNKWQLGPDNYNEDLWIIKGFVENIKSCQNIQDAQKVCSEIIANEKKKWQFAQLRKNDAILYETFKDILAFCAKENISIEQLIALIDQNSFWPKVGSRFEMAPNCDVMIEQDFAASDLHPPLIQQPLSEQATFSKRIRTNAANHQISTAQMPAIKVF